MNCFNSLMIYLVMILPMLIFVQNSLFMVYVSRQKMPPEQIYIFLKKLPAGDNLLSFIAGTSWDDPYVLDRLRIPYWQSVGGLMIFISIWLAGVFFIFLGLARAIQSGYPVEIISGLLWTCITLITSYWGIVSFWQKLKTYDD